MNVGEAYPPLKTLLQEGEAVLCVFNGLCLNSHNKALSMVGIKWNTAHTLYIVHTLYVRLVHTCVLLPRMQKSSWPISKGTNVRNFCISHTNMMNLNDKIFWWYVMRQKYIGRIQTQLISGNCWLCMCGKSLMTLFRRLPHYSTELLLRVHQLPSEISKHSWLHLPEQLSLNHTRYGVCGTGGTSSNQSVCLFFCCCMSSQCICPTGMQLYIKFWFM